MLQVYELDVDQDEDSQEYRLVNLESKIEKNKVLDLGNSNRTLSVDQESSNVLKLKPLKLAMPNPYKSEDFAPGTYRSAR